MGVPPPFPFFLFFFFVLEIEWGFWDKSRNLAGARFVPKKNERGHFASYD